MGDDFKLHFEMMLSFAAFPIVSTLVTYQIAEKLELAPQTAESLSISSSIDSSHLFRYLRLASYFDIFSFDPVSKLWSNTSKSLLLTTQLSRSLWLMRGSNLYIEPFNYASEVIKSSEDPRSLRNEPSFFDSVYNSPDLAEKFQDCMNAMTWVNKNEIVEGICFDKCNKVLDVGGADGTLIIELAKKYPDLKAGIFDRPEISERANMNIIENQMMGQVEFVAGDFFKEIVGGYNCIVLKHILHDWRDSDAVKILNNCKSALENGGKLIIVERVMDCNPKFYYENLMLDILMLLLLNGKERTRSEFEKILFDSGFRIVNIKNALYENIIEAEPIA